MADQMPRLDAPQAQCPADPDRRKALAAIGKYSAVFGAGSVVVLSADEALAMQPCSQHPQPQPGQNCTS